MMSKVIGLLLLFCVAIQACNINTFQVGQRTFARCQDLTPNYHIYWRVVGDDVVIALNLKGNPGGWLGFGISINGGMKGADIVVAQLVDGRYTLQDRYATQYAQPAIDDEQNLEFLDQVIGANETTIVYSRRIKPCDIEQDIPIPTEGWIQVIYAFGATPNIRYHGTLNRGTSVIYWFDEDTSGELPSDAVRFDVRTKPYIMPDKDTTYTCSSHALPTDAKYHVVRWDPVVGGEHIHHIALYACLANPNTPDPYECPMNPGLCSDLMFAWSLGQRPQTFMGEFAYPVGAAFKFAVLQIHYNNPTHISGLQDTSGFALTLTKQLRPYDMQSLPISYTILSVFVPAHTPAADYVAECPRECTERKLPPQGVKIVNWFPHMHQIGQKMWLQHIRNGVELPEIHRDDHYDFKKQQTFPVDVSFMPGDTLRIHCQFNATDKDTNTTGGEASTQEMCVGLVQFYPAVPGFPRCRRDVYPVPEPGGNCGDPRVNGTFPTVPVVPLEFVPLPPPVSPCLPPPCEASFNQVKTGGWTSGSQQWTQWQVTLQNADRPLYSAEIKVTPNAASFSAWNIDAVAGKPNVYTIPAWQYVDGAIPAGSTRVTFGYTISSATKATFELNNYACTPKSCPLAITPKVANTWTSGSTRYQDVKLEVQNTGNSPAANVKLQFDFYGGAWLSSSYNLAPNTHNAAELSKNFTCSLWNLQPGQKSSGCGYILAVPWANVQAENVDVNVAQAICI